MKDYKYPLKSKFNILLSVRKEFERDTMPKQLIKITYSLLNICDEQIHMP